MSRGHPLSGPNQTHAQTACKIPPDRPTGLSLYRQPIIDLFSGDIINHEILLRVNHRSPGRFLRVFEQAGTMLQIDHWVIGQAAELHGRVAVNVSGQSLADPQALGMDRLSAGTIIEITEHGFRTLRQMKRAVDLIHDLGLEVSLDDYGDGLHGRSTLDLPFDNVKIRARNRFRAKVSQVRSKGHSDIVAEMIETESDLREAVSCGARYGQGFLLGAPKPDAGSRHKVRI